MYFNFDGAKPWAEIVETTFVGFCFSNILKQTVNDAPGTNTTDPSHEGMAGNFLISAIGYCRTGTIF